MSVINGHNPQYPRASARNIHIDSRNDKNDALQFISSPRLSTADMHPHFSPINQNYSITPPLTVYTFFKIGHARARDSLTHTVRRTEVDDHRVCRTTSSSILHVLLGIDPHYDSRHTP